MSLGCHPPEGVTPDLFYVSDLVLSTILCKFSHIFFINFFSYPEYPEVTPLEGVTQSGPPQPPP